MRSLEISCDRCDEAWMDIFSGHNSPVNMLLGRLKFMERLTVASPKGVRWPPYWFQRNPALALTHIRLLFPIPDVLDIGK